MSLLDCCFARDVSIAGVGNFSASPALKVSNGHQGRGSVVDDGDGDGEIGLVMLYGFDSGVYGKRRGAEVSNSVGATAGSRELVKEDLPVSTQEGQLSDDCLDGSLLPIFGMGFLSVIGLLGEVVTSSRTHPVSSEKEKRVLRPSSAASLDFLSIQRFNDGLGFTSPDRSWPRMHSLCRELPLNAKLAP